MLTRSLKLKPRFNHFSILKSRFSSGGFHNPTPRSLDSIVKKDLLQEETPDEIGKIWTNYHEEKDDCVASTLAKEQYQTFLERTKECPYFVYPVHRSEGMFTIISQVQDKYCLFTYLEAFRLNPAQAPPYLTMSVFDELMQDKEIALFRGDIAHELNKDEATKLMNQMMGRYIDDELYQAVYQFNKRPQEFDFDAYLKDCH